MTASEFDVIMEQRIVAIRRVLGIKAGEYASSKDRLHNFKAAARLNEGLITEDGPAEALMGMLRKHWVSVMDIASRHNFPDPVPESLIDEKIGDAINYLILLEAVMKENQ